MVFCFLNPKEICLRSLTEMQTVYYEMPGNAFAEKPMVTNY